MPLQVRRGQTAERQAITPVVGELIWDTQLEQLFIGNGTTAGGIAAANYTNEEAQDAAADLFTSHSDHTGISFSYNDVLDKVVATVNQDLSNYQGVIGADGFKGSLFADDSQILVDGVLGSFNLNGTIRTHVVPAADEVYDLGAVGAKFRDLYLSGSSIQLGDATITSSGTAVNLPAGSTIDGIDIGAGDFKGSVFGDDSTVLVDAVNNLIPGEVVSGTITADLIGTVVGDINGSVFGDDSTILVDAIDSAVNANTLTTNTITSQGVATGSRDKPLFIGTETENHSLVIYGQKRNLENRIAKQSNGSYEYGLSFYTSQGTHSTPTAVGNNEQVGGILFSAYNGSIYDTVGGMEVYTNGTVSGSEIPSKVSINVGNLSLAPSDIKFFEFLNDGGLKITTLSSPPSNPTIGAFYLADGSGWDPGTIGSPHIALWDGSTFRTF